MTKTDLIAKIAKKLTFSKNMVRKITQALLDEIVKTLKSNSKIELRRFGVFSTIKQKPRQITLPTGEQITRPSQKVLLFKTSPIVKKKLNPPNKTRSKKQTT
jgi:integration host factor subunit beta